MKIRTNKMLAAMVGLLGSAIAASTAVASDHEEHESRQPAVVGDFLLDLSDPGVVEASVVVGMGQDVRSVAIFSDDVKFGPAIETEPGLWIAIAAAVPGVECYAATSEVELGIGRRDDDSDRDDRDEHHDRGEHDFDADHASRSRSHGDMDHADDRHQEDGEHEHRGRSVVMRLGAAACTAGAACTVPPVQQAPQAPRVPSAPSGVVF